MANDNQCLPDGMALKGRSFEYEKKRYDCTDVRWSHGRCTVYTAQVRTFVKDPEQLARFLRDIKPIDANAPVKPAFVPDKENLPLKQYNTMDRNEIVALDASVSTADNITKKLEDMFNILSGTPTDEDYKRAEAMSKVANTVVSVAQTKINFLNVKEKLQK